MTVTLYISELLYDLKNKNDLEVSALPDAEIRYRVQAGSEKDDELKRDIIEATAHLSSELSRFLTHRYYTDSDNIIGLPDAIVFDFAPNERRHINKIPAVADMLHSIIVNMAMGRYYQSVSMADLAKERESRAALDLKTIQTLIYEKLPPPIPTRDDYGIKNNTDIVI